MPQKGKTRYRYYISQKLVTGVTQADEKQRTWRIPALPLEGAIAKAVQKRIRQLSEATNVQKFPGTETPIPDAREAFEIVERVQISPGKLTISLNARQTQKLVGSELECDPDDLTLELPFTERRRGVEMKIIVGDRAANVDQVLVENVALANQWYPRPIGNQRQRLRASRGVLSR